MLLDQVGNGTHTYTCPPLGLIASSDCEAVLSRRSSFSQVSDGRLRLREQRLFSDGSLHDKM